VALAFVGITAGSLGLSGCEAESRGSGKETPRPTEAGLLATPGADVSDQETPMVLRRVWAEAEDLVGASISADRKYLTFIDWLTGNLMIREVATGETEAVTYDGSYDPQELPMEAAISSDGKQVAYVWWRLGGPIEWELRIVERGTGEPRILFGDEACTYLSPVDWTPSGEEVLFTCSVADEGTRRYVVRLLRVPTTGGPAALVKTFGTNQDLYEGGALSPNGRHLAYSFRENGESADRDISVLNLETGSTTPLIQNPGSDWVLGWSPDGQYVLFASDRAGALGAWLQRVEEDRPIGDPRLVKADLWRIAPIGVTEDGAFFYGVDLVWRKLYTASIDLETGTVLSQPTGVSEDLVTMELEPDWSPNGQFLAFRSRNGNLEEGQVIVVQDVRTGEKKLIETEFHLGDLRWYPDNRRLLVTGRDQNDQDIWFRVSVDTGDVELLPALEGLDFGTGNLIDWAPNGVEIFHSSPEGIYVVNTETGTHKELYPGKIGLYPALSSDGSHVAFADTRGDQKALWVIPTSGGEPRPLVLFEEPPDSVRWKGQVWGIAWSADDETVLFLRDGEVGAGLWMVPASGGTPERMDLAVPGMDGFPGTRDLRLHPDGRRIVFTAVGAHREAWVMENFLPVDGDGGS
jgi:Tol biopolymer transport system component